MTVRKLEFKTLLPFLSFFIYIHCNQNYRRKGQRSLRESQERGIVPTRILLFLFYSYVKSHLDNDSCLPIYKTIPAICNTPHKNSALRHGDFSDYTHVVGRVLCVGAAPKKNIFRGIFT